jgi:hypothetical protein
LLYNKRMNPQAILRLYDQEMRKEALPGLATIYKQPGLTFFTIPQPSLPTGWVIYTQLDAGVADQVIQSTIDFFKQYGGEFEWKVYGHDTPSDLKERLLAHGFISEDPEAVLALDLETVAPGFWEPPSASIHRITDSDQLGEIARIEGEAWAEPFTDLEESLGAEMLATPEQISIYVAYAGEMPASCAWIRFYPGRQFAELYGGATSTYLRGKGLYTALVKVRAQEAHQRGVRFLVVDTSPMSRPILERLGFVFLTYSQPFIMKFSGALAR